MMARQTRGPAARAAVDRRTMAGLERRAESEFGISPAELMENAGRGVARLLLCAPEVPRGLTVFVCGPGNNGGDGLVAAR